MPSNPPVDELRERLTTFIEWWRANIHGDEKGQSQVFLDRLFRALGHDGVFDAGATLEERIKAKSRGGTAFADLVWKPRSRPSSTGQTTGQRTPPKPDEHRPRAEPSPATGAFSRWLQWE